VSESSQPPVGILGAGAWGIALAMAVRRAGAAVIMWARDPAQAERLNRRHADPRLPGISLDPAIAVTADLRALADAEPLLLAVPAQAARGLLRRLVTRPGTLVICAKGLEQGTGLRLSEVVAAELPGTVPAVLSGPSFAAEAATGLPAALTLAAPDLDAATALAHRLASPAFRLYPSDDVAGVELGGALKNVIAIAAGAVMGRGLGENARAALITRGLAEIGRLCAAVGGRRETLTGLSGLGDLMLTATSLTSRNTRFGYELGRGRLASELLTEGAALSEGTFTAEAACRLAASLGVELPIATAVRAVIAGKASIATATDTLLARPLAARE
jgi:glycerol-3-phosphate dehydrogenase (NAD(P)+)